MATPENRLFFSFKIFSSIPFPCSPGERIGLLSFYGALSAIIYTRTAITSLASFPVCHCRVKCVDALTAVPLVKIAFRTAPETRGPSNPASVPNPVPYTFSKVNPSLFCFLDASSGTGKGTSLAAGVRSQCDFPPVFMIELLCPLNAFDFLLHFP